MQDVNSASPLEMAIKKVEDIANEIVEIKAQVDSMKPLYDRLDKLTLQLLSGLNALGIKEVWVPEKVISLSNSTQIIQEQFVSVVDNFSEKNTVFRPAGVKRFELHAESVAARSLREQKAIAKAHRGEQ